MTKWLAVLTAVVALVIARVDAQQPMFSAQVDTVRVDVDVQRGGKPVPGLGAGDFEVLDNGVPQKVELMAAASAPVNVVIVLDTSKSLDAKQRAHLTAAGSTLIDALRPDEQAAFVTFTERVAIRSLFSSDAP